MENRTRVRCPENEELASFMWNKWKEMAAQPKGLSENKAMTLCKARFNVLIGLRLGFVAFQSNNAVFFFLELCVSGAGKMIYRPMQGFFGTGSGGIELGTSSGGTEQADLTKKGNRK
ncbi:unnamed protein product [Vicia faba]|uniref:Uncharacterized protein n=1 Tax=Vicia faba TaxID=3906 RepID=A0AAV0ZEU9_VICFA|nr:unnamed protein product [Vicia faba]